jgi:hypothetical protein
MILDLLALLVVSLGWIRAEDWAGASEVRQIEEDLRHLVTQITVSTRVATGWWISACGALVAVVGGLAGLRKGEAPEDPTERVRATRAPGPHAR